MIEQLRETLEQDTRLADGGWSMLAPHDRLTLEALLTILERLSTMDSRIKVIEDGVVAEQPSIAKLGTVVPLLVGLLASQAAALTAAQATLAGEPSDEEIAGVATTLGTQKDQIDTLVNALQGALPAPAPTLSVGPSTLAVAIGATGQITGTASDGSTVTYSTSDDTIATVDASGVVTGVAAGTATISAHDAAGETADAVVTVS